MKNKLGWVGVFFFISLINMTSVRAESFSPLTLSPSALWMNHRDVLNTTTPLFDVVGSISGALTIWDVRNGTSNYKTTSGGSWVDGSGETWTVSKLYDQTGNGNNIVYSVNPALVFNQDLGFPDIVYSGYCRGTYSNSLFSDLTSFEIVVRLNSDTSNSQGAIIRESDGNSNYVRWLNKWNSYNHYMVGNTSIGYVLKTGQASVYYNDYFTFDGSETGAARIKIYWDNVLQIPYQTLGTIPAACPDLSTSDKYIGYDPETVNYIKGKFNTICVFSTVLTTTQRTDLNTYLENDGIYSDDITITATVPSTLTFTIDGVASGVACANSGGNASVTTTSTTIPFGTYTGSQTKIACQTLTVSTNATNGYIVTVEQDQDLTSAGSDTIAKFSGTYASPTTWASPPGSGTESYFGFTTDDSDYSDFQTSKYSNFAANLTPYAVALETLPVIDEANVISYQLEVTNLQEAGTYTNTVMYIATATF